MKVYLGATPSRFVDEFLNRVSQGSENVVFPREVGFYQVFNAANCLSEKSLEALD
jgi:hypothetical protein